MVLSNSVQNEELVNNSEDDGERGNNGSPHLVIANCIVGDDVLLSDVFDLIRA